MRFQSQPAFEKKARLAVILEFGNVIKMKNLSTSLNCERFPLEKDKRNISCSANQGQYFSIQLNSTLILAKSDAKYTPFYSKKLCKLDYFKQKVKY
jgi:hypothetical protein